MAVSRCSGLRLACLLCAAAVLVAADATPAAADTTSDTGAAAAAGGEQPQQQQRPPFIVLKPQDSWVLEGCAVALLLTFIVNLWLGRRANERIALHWTSELVAPGGVLHQNFALLGPGDSPAGEVLLKESQNCYKFWASGRRFCHGLLATFHLVPRQDLLARAVHALRRAGDWLEVEVQVAEGCMPPMVLAVAPPSALLSLKRDHEELKTFCKRVELGRERAQQWPERLGVMAEHPSLLHDLLAPQLLDLAFGREAFEGLRPYFRSLLISSEAPEGHRQVIRLAFDLPRAGDSATLARFLQLACLLADLVGGCYKLSPEQAKRATEARAKRDAEAAREAADERNRRAEERRLAKLAEEQERLRKLPPDQRQREVEKRQKLQQGRRMRKMSKAM